MKHLLIFLTALCCWSCNTMYYTTIEVLKPARVSFAPQAENILLLNNTIKQPDDYGHKDEFWSKSTKRLVIETDSLPLFTLSALYEELSANGFFRNVELQLESENTGNDFFTVQTPNADKVKELCKTYNADVILSLDRLKVNDLIGELYDSENSSSYFALVARYESQWSVLYPNRTDKEKFMFNDTIFWEAENSSRQIAFSELPNRFDALVDGALFTGQNTLNRLIPYWTTADRYLISSKNKALKQGLDSVYVQNWQAAISIWQAAMQNAGNTLKGKLANNLAVAYEFTGDINSALLFAQIALENVVFDSFLPSNFLANLQDYVEQLKIRKNDIQLINYQLSETPENQ